jgi:hypothetical protein
MPGDLIMIYRTLEILAIYNKKSLASFVIGSFHPEDNYWDAIRRMATALDHLTYAVGQVSAGQFDKVLNKMSEEVIKFRQRNDIKKELFKRKRLWCSLRDYLKSPEFNQVFVAALKNNGMENPERWDKKNLDAKTLGAIELPGDVWNNAKVFRDGLFSSDLIKRDKNLDMPQTIRIVYEHLIKDHDLQFYPEQLDVTFDFVPRMCQRNMCDVCLFGNGIEQVCHKKSDCLCSVSLISCGYKQICNPEKCKLKENGVKKYCRNSMTTSIPG